MELEAADRGMDLSVSEGVARKDSNPGGESEVEPMMAIEGTVSKRSADVLIER